MRQARKRLRQAGRRQRPVCAPAGRTPRAQSAARDASRSRFCSAGGPSPRRIFRRSPAPQPLQRYQSSHRSAGQCQPLRAGSPCAPAIIREIYQAPACIYKADTIYTYSLLGLLCRASDRGRELHCHERKVTHRFPLTCTQTQPGEMKSKNGSEECPLVNQDVTAAAQWHNAIQSLATSG